MWSFGRALVAGPAPAAEDGGGLFTQRSHLLVVWSVGCYECCSDVTCASAACSARRLASEKIKRYLLLCRLSRACVAAAVVRQQRSNESHV